MKTIKRDKTTTFKTVKEAAAYLSAQFESREGKDGQRFLKETAQEWCVDAVRDANDSNLNLDLCYKLTEEGADWISDLTYEVDSSADLFDDDRPEGDIYTADCTRWLASDIDHVALVDDAVSELGTAQFDLIQMIQYAQSRQKEEVFISLWDWLKENIVDDEAEYDEGLDDEIEQE